jgi:4,5-dihydroxyphthalate decarboxylase
MAGIPLTLTCGDYEITRLLAEGAVTADGIDLTVLTDIASRDRHWRLARNGECDAGEFNAFGYFMAKERGHPFIALPVFPHRRFRHGFVFVNPTKGIRTPHRRGGLPDGRLRMDEGDSRGVLRGATPRNHLGAAPA